MKINDPNWYPSYLNPSFDEILELAKSGWDTCRILIPYDKEKDGSDLVIASGYGNTHNSVQNRYFIHLGATPIEVNRDGIIRQRWKTIGAVLPQMWSCILHHKNGIAYMNLEDTGGGAYDRADKWPLSDKHMEILKDLIRESDLAL